MSLFRQWWGDDKPSSFYDYLDVPYRAPHWSAKPFRAIAEEVRKGRELAWFQRPVGVVFLAVAGSVIAAGIAKKIGWI
jgi:hypothetical protein